MKNFLKFTKPKIVIFLIAILVNVVIGFFILSKIGMGNELLNTLGYILILEIFGLNVFVGEVLNVSVTQGSALDVFPVLWPNVLGIMLIVLNVIIVLFVHYLFASVISKIFIIIKSKN